MYPHHPSYTTHARFVPTSPLTSPLYIIHASRVQLLNKFFIYQPDDGQWKVPKHVVVNYVINYIYIYPPDSCVRQQIHSNSKLTGPQVAKQLPALCGIRKFIPALTIARYLSLSLATATVHASLPNFLKTHINLMCGWPCIVIQCG